MSLADHATVIMLEDAFHNICPPKGSWEVLPCDRIVLGYFSF
jgi:hypothetical protein